jgi:hypothetical protein
VKIDREIERLRFQPSAEGHVTREARNAMTARRDNQFIDVRVVRNDRRRGRLDDVGQMSGGKLAADGVDGGSRKDDVADFTQADEQDAWRVRYSSMSITGMSSLIGYTRLHVAHLSADPFLTRVTGVLQLGQARISSSSGSTGMRATI